MKNNNSKEVKKTDDIDKIYVNKQADNLIKVVCETDLKGFEEDIWPMFFVVRPQLGDHVRSNKGNELKIDGITHCEDFTANSNKYYLEITLGRPY